MTSNFNYSIAANVLRDGGIVAYPTEAVFGLGCNPHDPNALKALLTLKQRSPALGLIVIGASIDAVMPYLAKPSDIVIKKLHRSWPGPTTWIVEAQGLNDWVTGGRDTVAVRVPDHPVCQGLCRAFGDVVVSTSANVSGRPPALNRLQLRAQFPTGIHHIMGGQLGDAANPSQIIDCRTDRVLRQS
ncbi:MAG: L-threonylcarbamoyladenylate synthase [Pseudomonadota bacterium]